MNSYEHTSRDFLPLSVIRSACAGDTDAVEQVLQHYRGYINKLCTGILYDKHGQPHVCIDLNVFEAVKQSVTTRQAAEHYGIHVGRNGMACCPFHHDKTPSMKLDRRYHCFGCGADGDVIDFAAALYGLGKKEAAVQLAQDFGLSYEDWKPPGKAKKPKPRQKSPEEQFQEAKNRCSRILADYRCV